MQTASALMRRYRLSTPFIALLSRLGGADGMEAPAPDPAHHIVTSRCRRAHHAAVRCGDYLACRR